MGEATLVENNCTTVAVRYRFVFKKQKDGDRTLQYLPHQVVKCELPPTPPAEEEKEEDVEFEEVDVKYLRTLDPKEWKHQDHYKVLGLEKVRIKATDEQIKTAHRKMVLKHHPDKRKAQGEEIRTDDDYFTCITMAYETLGNPTKRRSYDSVDPNFDDSLPSSNSIKQDFYKTFYYYFRINSRWSERRKIPQLGDDNSPRDAVEKFYSFWYDFKSWREYSYEDEEDKDKCQDRDERRYVDKMNKAERLRKKKEEMSRIRQLVDLAYNADPRIAKFKQEDKDRKLAAKKAKQNAAQQRKEEEERLLREAQLAKEKADAEEKARIDAKRQEREAQKKILKKERKSFRDSCKTNNYYTQKEADKLKHMTAVDQICETFSALELQELNNNLKNSNQQAFTKAMQESQSRIENEKKSVLDSYNQRISEQIQNNAKNKSVILTNAEWDGDHLQLLIKAVNLFPAGTNQRWEVVANFINQHGIFPENVRKFSAKQVLAKAKDLQSTDFSKNNLKEAANQQAFDNLKKDKRNIVAAPDSGISTKIDEEKALKKKQKVESGQPVNGIQNGDIKDKQWTTNEQQLLEQALKTYPASTQDRWDRIAECVPGRSKKECMKRYKELVEIVKAKKAAQSAAGGK